MKGNQLIQRRDWTCALVGISVVSWPDGREVVCWRAVGSTTGGIDGTQGLMCRKEPLLFSSTQGA